QARPDLLLLQLRGPAGSTIADADLLGAHRRAERRRLLGIGCALRSADAGGRRCLHGICRKSDSRWSIGSSSPGAVVEGAAPDEPRIGPEPPGGWRRNQP